MSDNPSSPEKQDPAEIIALAMSHECRHAVDPNAPYARVMFPASARSAIEALRAAGWAIVPREPTEAMCMAGEKATGGDIRWHWLPTPWRAMVEAAGGGEP